MNKLIFISLAASVFYTTGAAYAAQVRQMLPACISEEYLSDVTDRKSLKQLIDAKKCIILTVGDEVKVIRNDWVTATILHKGIELFVPSEAIK